MTPGADELHFMCCAQSTGRKRRRSLVAARTAAGKGETSEKPQAAPASAWEGLRSRPSGMLEARWCRVPAPRHTKPSMIKRCPALATLQCALGSAGMISQGFPAPRAGFPLLAWNIYRDPNSPAGKGDVSSGTLGPASLIPPPSATPYALAPGTVVLLQKTQNSLAAGPSRPPGRNASGSVFTLAVAGPFCRAPASQGRSDFPLGF